MSLTPFSAPFQVLLLLRSVNSCNHHLTGSSKLKVKCNKTQICLAPTWVCYMNLYRTIFEFCHEEDGLWYYHIPDDLPDTQCTTCHKRRTNRKRWKDGKIFVISPRNGAVRFAYQLINAPSRWTGRVWRVRFLEMLLISCECREEIMLPLQWVLIP